MLNISKFQNVDNCYLQIQVLFELCILHKELGCLGIHTSAAGLSGIGGFMQLGCLAVFPTGASRGM